MQVFVDESARRAYLLGAAIVIGSAAPLRTVLRGLCRPGQRRLHFSQESDQRRRSILSTLEGLDLRVRVYRSGSEPDVARAGCLRALLEDVVPAGARRLVIESRDRQDAEDDDVIRAVLRARGTGGLSYRHATPYEEPLLWVPDAVTWAVGRAGDWRRRVEPVFDKVVDLDP